MSEQPSGKVTLVFTDIEGSTRLLDELGTDAYREALGKHRRVVREAFEAPWRGWAERVGRSGWVALPSSVSRRATRFCS